ncbi:MAG: universal stress protein [Planctomycetaceae bacterium]
MITLNNILLPTDFSEPSLAATRYALELARRFSSRLHLLHVIEDPSIVLPLAESYPFASREDFEKLAQTELENWILPDDRAGVDLVYRWRHGTPFAEIVRDAREHDVDLIVLGTHGRGMLAQLLMGSTAEKVVRKAECPVLTVRPEGHQFVHPIEAVP